MIATGKHQEEARLHAHMSRHDGVHMIPHMVVVTAAYTCPPSRQVAERIKKIKVEAEETDSQFDKEKAEVRT